MNQPFTLASANKKLTFILLASAQFSSVPALSFGQQVTLVYEEILDHPYSQGWYASYIEEQYKSVHRIYVRGEGKIGDFIGVLSLNCLEPQYSNWEAQGGMLTDSAVPHQAITAIRKSFCTID